MSFTPIPSAFSLPSIPIGIFIPEKPQRESKGKGGNLREKEEI